MYQVFWTSFFCWPPRYEAWHIAILVQFKVATLELISKSRHPLFYLVTFLCWSHILTSAYISKVKFSQAPSPWGWTWPSTEAEQDVEYEREFKCDQCEQIFIDNNQLVRHMRDVHSDRNKCSLCTETFSSKINLNQHMQNVHKTQEEINLCCNCGKILSKKETLLSHERRCTSIERWRKMP